MADTCVTRLSLKIPAVVDDLENSTEAAYTAWPDRLYVIGADGCIAYKSKPGPYGFQPDQVAATLKRILPATPATRTAQTRRNDDASWVRRKIYKNARCATLFRMASLHVIAILKRQLEEA